MLSPPPTNEPKAVDFTIPYVASGALPLFQKSKPISSIADLKGKKVSVARGSTNDTLMTKQYPSTTVVRFDTIADAIQAVKSGKVDACMEGFATVSKAVADDPSLAALDVQPISPALISMGVKQGDQILAELPEQLHPQPEQLRPERGHLQEVVQRRPAHGHRLPVVDSLMTWYLGDLIPYLPLILKGLWVSIYVSVASFVAGSALGLIAYRAKVGESATLKRISSVYIEVVRNVPLLVVLYLIYFGLGQLGINLNPLWSTLIALTINNGAYVAEILRAGFDSVPGGLREAAQALGMNSRQTFRYVIFVPGIRKVFPALTNQFILLFLFSSVASVIALPELTDALMTVNSNTLRTFEVFTVGALLYYAVSSVLAVGSRVGEKRLFTW